MELKGKTRKMYCGRPSHSSSAILFSLFASYPIRETLCLSLPIQSIVSVSRTCKQLSQVYKDLLRIQLNIDMKLSRFVSRPRALRAQLRETHAIISGSFAVQFFDRDTYPDSDLDIYVERGDQSPGLVEYLTMVEGYMLFKSIERDQYNPKTIHRVCDELCPIGRQAKLIIINLGSYLFETIYHFAFRPQGPDHRNKGHPNCDNFVQLLRYTHTKHHHVEECSCRLSDSDLY
jgi:hypothetical protein